MSFYRDFNDKTALESWNTRQHPKYETITVTPISPTIGAEISGIDLSQELSAAQLADVKRAIADNLVLVFRDQNISAVDLPRPRSRTSPRFLARKEEVLRELHITAASGRTAISAPLLRAAM